AAEDQRAIAAQLVEAVQPSLAHVEYELLYDNGQRPYGSGWATRCPNCGRYHGEDTDELVTEERPAELTGFIVAPDQVLTADFMMHPRFVKRINVRYGDQTVAATVKTYYHGHKAALLQLEQPLTGAKPLAFAQAEGPYYAITPLQQNGAWQTTAQPLRGALTAVAEDWPPFIPVAANAPVVTLDGVPITIATNEELPADDS